MLGEVNPQIVIMTSSAQKAEEFSKQHNIMVLPKPFSERDFFFTYNQILAKATELRFKPFGIKVGGSIIQIYPREITYIESLRRKVDIHTDHGTMWLSLMLMGLSSKQGRLFLFHRHVESLYVTLLCVIWSAFFKGASVKVCFIPYRCFDICILIYLSDLFVMFLLK